MTAYGRVWPPELTGALAGLTGSASLILRGPKNKRGDAALKEPRLEQTRETRLVGWKRIAAHLGCSERTARRWEQEEGLPVHRQQHESRSTIYAVPSELDQWIASRTEVADNAVASRVPSRLRQGWIPLIASVFVLVLVSTFAVVSLLPNSRNGDEATALMSEDPAAIDLYERGRMLWAQRGEAQNARAIKLLTQAVERDETFAEAWSALALAWLTYPTYNSEIAPETALDEALLAADRAVQLDPSLAEPRSVMASVAQRRGDWIRSEEVFQTALEADPDNTTLMLWFAGHNRELGRMAAADQLTQDALALDPNSPPVLTETAMNYFQGGNLETGREMLDYLWFDIGFEVPIVWFGRWSVLMETGQYDLAEAWIEKTPFPSGAPLMVEYISRKRDPDLADDTGFAARMMTAYENGLPGWFAYHLLDLSGLPDAALDILDLETRKGEFYNSVVLFFPRGSTARQNDRFADLVERLGFFDYWARYGPPDICADEPETELCQRVQE